MSPTLCKKQSGRSLTFVPLYRVRSGPTIPWMEEMLIMLPRRLSFMASAKVRVMWNTPTAFTSMEVRNASVGSSYRRIGRSTALFTSTSIFPCSRRIFL